MSDSPQDRLAKLLPGDVTAAFLSAKAALVASAPEEDVGKYVVWTLVAVIGLCPVYFRYKLGVTIGVPKVATGFDLEITSNADGLAGTYRFVMQ